MGIFILSKHNGEYQGWHEIDKKQLKEWMSDGSINEGDTIVYAKKVMKVVMEKKLKLIKSDALQKDGE